MKLTTKTLPSKQNCVARSAAAMHVFLGAFAQKPITPALGLAINNLNHYQMEIND